MLPEQRNQQKWWGLLVQKLPLNYEFGQSFVATSLQSRFNMYLIDALKEALVSYKLGIRPRAEAVVSIKRRLFCHSFSPKLFLHERWNFYRALDTEDKQPEQSKCE